MTIRFIRAASMNMPIGTIRTLAPAVESALIADGEAVPHTMPNDPSNDLPVRYDPENKQIVLQGGENIDLQSVVSGAWTSDNSGAWASVRSVTMRLRMTGTGTVTMDSRNAAGTITLAVYTATVSGSTLVEYAYPGDDADSIRVALTGTATAEVI